jgi:hypothetical protein
MAITLGTFTKLGDGVYTGILKTLNVSAALTIASMLRLQPLIISLPHGVWGPDVGLGPCRR